MSLADAVSAAVFLYYSFRPPYATSLQSFNSSDRFASDKFGRANVDGGRERDERACVVVIGFASLPAPGMIRGLYVSLEYT